MLLDNINYKVTGHLRIHEKETGKVLLDHHNAIHPENISIALAKSLAHDTRGAIRELVFGNGGVRVNASNEFLYSAPQTIGQAATLYNQTYAKVVDQNDGANTDKENNYITVSHITGNVYTDIMIHCTLNKGEPSSESVLNNETEIATQEYQFSEVGIKTHDGMLITHICHYPILKAQNITLVMDYNIRLQIV